MLYYSAQLPDIEFNIRVPEPSHPIGLPALYFFSVCEGVAAGGPFTMHILCDSTFFPQRKEIVACVQAFTLISGFTSDLMIDFTNGRIFNDPKRRSF
jgi:hypothetical protein